MAEQKGTIQGTVTVKNGNTIEGRVTAQTEDKGNKEK